MIKINRIIQKDTWSCFACVAAMITGKKVEDVFSFVGHDGSMIEEDSTHPEKRAGFGMVEILKYLLEHRFTIGTWSVFEDPADISGYDEIQFSLKLGEGPAVITVKSDRLGDECTHSIYWDGKTIYDPSPSADDNPDLSKYRVLKYMPVIYFEQRESRKANE